MGYFAFTGRLWLLGIQPRLTLSLTLLSLAATLFATSTTAYVGLAVFLSITYLDILIRTASGPSTPQMRLFAVGAPLLFAAIAVAVALSDTYSDMVRDLLDTGHDVRLFYGDHVDKTALEVGNRVSRIE